MSFADGPVLASCAQFLGSIIGMSNRAIANSLHRSERTIEVHRSHIMRKLNVDNVVDLVKRAGSLGFEEPE